MTSSRLDLSNRGSITKVNGRNPFAGLSRLSNGRQYSHRLTVLRAELLLVQPKMRHADYDIDCAAIEDAIIAEQLCYQKTAEDLFGSDFGLTVTTIETYLNQVFSISVEVSLASRDDYETYMVLLKLSGNPITLNLIVDKDGGVVRKTGYA